MMPMNRALAGSAARGRAERPGGSANGCVDQGDSDQTEHREKRTKAILWPRGHGCPKVSSMIRQKGVSEAAGWMIAPAGPAFGPLACGTLVAKRSNLDLACPASQTRSMAHTYGIYIRFDFGTDEEKAQQARHKLDGWRQAFRLDKRVQYKMDRPESAGAATEAPEKPAPAEKAAAAGKSKEKASGKAAAKAGEKSSEPASAKQAAAKPEAATNGKVGLLVRLYFSPHEKLSEQRWLARIPTEEPFKSASPRVIHQNDPEFETTDQQFESIS